MTKSQEILIHLSQEELFFLLAMLKTKTIPGFDPEAFDGITERDLALMLGVSERALVARGFLVPGEDGVRIEEAPMAIVGTCARPEYSIVVEVVDPKRSYGVYWHGNKLLLIEHSLPFTGIHKFKVLKLDVNLVDCVLKSVKEVEKSTVKELACKVPDDVFLQAREAAQGNGTLKKAVTILEKADVSKESAKALASSLQKAVQSVQVGFIRHHREEESEPDLFGGTLVNSLGASFLISLIDGENKIRIDPFSAADWEQWVKENLIKITS